MAETKRVFLHIGAPKTGTTYLQAVLAHNRGALRTKGVLYPPAGAGAHHMAAFDLRGTPSQRKEVEGIAGAWRAVAEKADGWHGRAVVISSELLVYCDPAEIATAVDSFSSEVHVVYTARDLVRQVPAVWQERIKNRQTLRYEDFAEAAVDPTNESGPHGFWRAQDAAAVLARWSQKVPPSRIHVVTTPPAGSPGTLLLERFASVFDLGLGDLATDIPPAANEALGLLQTGLLREYNKRYGHDMAWPLYRRTIRLQLESAFGAISDERRPTLAPAQFDVFRARAAAIVSAVRQAGYDVVGDLSDLIPVDPPARRRGLRKTPDPTTPVTTEELLGAAIDVMHATLTSLESRRGGRASKRQESKRGDREAKRGDREQQRGRQGERAPEPSPEIEISDA